MLECLPDDVIILIFKKLDFKSLANLYNASVHMQNIIIQYNVIKECNISLSTMGTMNTLQSKFFKDIAHNLSKLNLCAVFDLSKSSLIPVMRKLKNLKTLDVSHTPISLLDFVDIYEVCPTINDITINFCFGKKYPGTNVPKTTLLDCQNVFKHLECVHFVGNYCNLLYSSTAVYILSMAKLKKVQYTLSEQYKIVYRNINFNDKVQLDFDCFSLCTPFAYTSSNLEKIFPFFQLDFACYEYFVLNYFSIRPFIMSATKIFREFFQERFDLKCDSHDTNINVTGNVCIMFWRKQTNEFNDTFFDSLYHKIKNYFIYHYNDKWNPSTALKYNIFRITPRQIENTDIDSDVPLSFKKKRISLPNHVLNYDEEFKDKLEFELNLAFKNPLNSAVTLPSNCEYLHKITYLNLNGQVKYSSNFFNILFRSCSRLITLNIEVTNMCISMITRSVPLSRTIKNLRIVGKGIDLDCVIMSLSQCPSLENVHIADKSVEDQGLFDPTTMIEKCSYLYCVCIYKNGITERKSSRQLKLINEIKVKCNKMYIYFKIMKTDIELTYIPNQYIDVFRLYNTIY